MKSNGTHGAPAQKTSPPKNQKNRRKASGTENSNLLLKHYIEGVINFAVCLYTPVKLSPQYIQISS